MKRIIVLLSGAAVLGMGLASCTQVYPTREVNRSYYRSNTYRGSSSPYLGPAPQGSGSPSAVGQPDSFSGAQ